MGGGAKQRETAQCITSQTIVAINHIDGSDVLNNLYII